MNIHAATRGNAMAMTAVKPDHQKGTTGFYNTCPCCIDRVPAKATASEMFLFILSAGAILLCTKIVISAYLENCQPKSTEHQDTAETIFIYPESFGLHSPHRIKTITTR